MSDCLVNPRRAPSRHSRHARMDCILTKTVHDRSTPPTPPTSPASAISAPFSCSLMAKEKKTFWATTSSMTEAISTCALYKVTQNSLGWVCYNGDGTV